MTREEAIEELTAEKEYEEGCYKDGTLFDEDLIEALDMAIKALEYDDAKYHEGHGEVVVDKAVWEDAKKALEQEPILDKIRAEIEEQKECRCFDDNDMFVYITGLDDALYIIDKYKAERSDKE